MITFTPPPDPLGYSLTCLSSPIDVKDDAAYSGVGPCKHQLAGMPNDDSSGADVLDDHL